MNDPMILSGISQLVNKNKINESLDLEAIEKDLTHMKKIKSPTKKNFKIINNSESSISEACSTASSSCSDSHDETDSDEEDSQTENSESEGSEKDSSSEDLDSESESESDSGKKQKRRAVSKTRIRKTHSITPRGRSFSRKRERSFSRKQSKNYTPKFSPRSNMHQQDLREEQKETMIADIDWLIDELAQDEIDVSRVPAVNSDSSFKEVERVYKLVKNKYSRSRCDDLSKEIAIAGAKTLEMFFDGKKTYFGYKPDMTGWHRTVRTKMRRMNFERTQIVNSFLESNNISPIGRIAMELVPSAFLYSLSRREQFGQNNYTARDDQGEALNDLRDLD